MQLIADAARNVEARFERGHDVRGVVGHDKIAEDDPSAWCEAAGDGPEQPRLTLVIEVVDGQHGHDHVEPTFGQRVFEASDAQLKYVPCIGACRRDRFVLQTLVVGHRLAHQREKRVRIPALKLRHTPQPTLQPASSTSQPGNVHCNDPKPAAALPFGTTKGGLGRLERTIAIVALRSSRDGDRDGDRDGSVHAIAQVTRGAYERLPIVHLASVLNEHEDDRFARGKQARCDAHKRRPAFPATRGAGWYWHGAHAPGPAGTRTRRV